MSFFQVRNDSNFTHGINQLKASDFRGEFGDVALELSASVSGGDTLGWLPG